MRTKESVTLTDVAKAAGVSQATVSRVLNKHPRINAGTRNRVTDMVRALGYDTSSIERKALGRAVRSRERVLNFELLLCPLAEQRNMLGISFFSEVLNGLQFVFNQEGGVNHNISTWQLDDDEHNENLFRRLLKADGVLIMGNPSDELIARILAGKVRVVLISTGREECPADTVGTDNVTGGMLAARYLCERGLTRIGYLDGPETIHEWRERKAGIMMELMERNLLDSFSSRRTPSTDMADVIKTLRAWHESPDWPEALILPYSESILAVEIVLHEHHEECPRDLSVIGFGLCRSETLGVRPVCLDNAPRDIGIKAAERLLQIAMAPSPYHSAHKIVVPVKIIEGNSVKQP